MPTLHQAYSLGPRGWILLTVAVLLLVGIPALPLAQSSAAPAPPLRLVGTTAASVSMGPATQARPISPQFWGVDIEATHRFNATDAAAINSTPASYLVYPSGILGEEFNYTSGTVTALNGTQTTASTNLSSFVATCRLAGCHAILQLPAEIDRPALAAGFVRYVVDTVGFQPAYWMIGNDPSAWVHFNVSWAQWGSATGGNTSPVGFADLVHAYIVSVRAVDPTARFLALGAGAGSPEFDRSWVEALARVDGSLLTGIAVHSYVEQGPTNPTDAELFANLHGNFSLPAEIRADRTAVTDACPNCTNLSIFVTEINAAEIDSYLQLLPTFAGTVYLAAEITQGLALNATNLDWFAYDCNYAGAWSTRAMNWQDQYYLFRDIAPRLGTNVLPTSVAGGPGLYAAGTTGPSGIALLLVNVNTSTSISASLSGMGSNFTGFDTEYLWTNLTRQPVSSGVQVSGNVTLPAESIVLLTAPLSLRPATYPVRFLESGLPSGTGWSVTLGSTVNESTTPTVGFLSPNGSFAFAVSAPQGYLAEPAAGTATITGGAAELPIDFVPTSSTDYPVEISESGLPEGSPWHATVGGTVTSTTSSTLSLWEANGTYPYTVSPGPGYVATPASGSLVVSGAPAAIAISVTPIAGLFPVTFDETGLASGLAWALAVGGTTRGAIAPAPIVFALPNGTYSVAVGTVSGYAVAPIAGSVTLAGQPVSFAVPYQALRPPTGATIQNVLGVVREANRTGVAGVAVNLAFAEPGAVAVWVNLTSGGNGEFEATGLNLSGNLTGISLGASLYQVAWANVSWLSQGTIGLTVVVRALSSVTTPVGTPGGAPGSPSLRPLGLSLLEWTELAVGGLGAALGAWTVQRARRKARYRTYFRIELQNLR